MTRSEQEARDRKERWIKTFLSQIENEAQNSYTESETLALEQIANLSQLEESVTSMIQLVEDAMSRCENSKPILKYRVFYVSHRHTSYVDVFAFNEKDAEHELVNNCDGVLKVDNILKIEAIC